MQQAALFRRERQVGSCVIVAVIVALGLGFGVCLRHLRDLREIYCGFVLVVN